ncbi:uncharacterized protein LOC135081706 [Ostrinia nubilalis]|uniref:uncharacterized protein LOC135081706 n=1 Tax=Ostrinia nubilalis TaxID=29057 RepID=UPI0030822A22
MPPYYLLTLLLTLSAIEAHSNQTSCNGFESNFAMKAVVGPWYVVAIIPEKLYPDKPLTCYIVEFSEIDEAGLRWLVNKTVHHHKNLTDITGTIIRQRYYAEHPFDVWSKAAGTNGCFQQVLSLDADNSDITKALTQEAAMQLHIIDTDDGSGPYLVQMLWGRMISAVIYRKHKGVTQDQLRPIFELMSKLRGPQRLPRMCEKYQKEPLMFV